VRGNLRSRKSGTWELTVELPRNPRTGKRQHHYEAVKGTKKEAEHRLAGIIDSVERNRFVRPTRITFGEWLWRWFGSYVTANCDRRTQNSYEAEIRNHLEPKLGAVRLAELTPQHLRDYYAGALVDGRLDGKGGLSTRTVHYQHTIISGCLKHAVEDGYLVRNVAEAVKPPRVRHREIFTLAPRFIPTFLLAIRGSLHYILYYTDFATGMRLSEICALCWDRVDLERGFISINRSLFKRQGLLIIKDTKSRHSRRRIDIPASLVRLLREHRRSQENIGLMLGRPLEETDFVFSRPGNQLVDPTTVSKGFTSLIRRAGLPYLNFHGMRHTHATLLLAAGVNPKVVSERLGHASVAFTLDTYAHVLPTMQTEAAEKFDRVIFDELFREDGSSGGSNGTTVYVGKMLVNHPEDVDITSGFESEPHRSRTCNLLIKSQLLCRLS